jgi:hypothetical protein
MRTLEPPEAALRTISDIGGELKSARQLQFSQFSSIIAKLSCNFYYNIKLIHCYKYVFRCSACDSLFPSLMALEHHKEEFEHWSGDESIGNTESDDESSDDTVTSEELERLL